MDLARDEPVGAFSHGFSDAFRQSLIHKYARIWMLQSGFHMWPVGVQMHLPEILPEDEFEAGAFYREWCRPQNNRDYVGMIAFRDSTRFVKMTQARLAENGSYPAEAVARMRLLAPHICRSVAISDAFRLERVRAGMFETMLDSLTTGVLLVTPTGKIEHMNIAAREMVAKSQSFRIERGSLRLSNRDANARLRETLSRAYLHPENREAGAEFLTIADSDNAGFIATVVPLSRPAERHLLQPSRRSIAIFLRDPTRRPLFAVEAFAELYRLTPGETRVAAILGQGGNLAAACDMLGISLPTAKTHLQRIFEKTGTARQADLVALMTGSAL